MPQAKRQISSRKQPRQSRSARLVEDVLEAAVQVLSREGAQRFTTARVALAAGVSVGSIYQYFPNKESILFRLQLDEWRGTVGLLTAITAARDVTPAERLRAAIMAFLRSECDEAPIRTALADAAPLFRNSMETAAFRRSAFRPFLAFWREVLPGLPPHVRKRAVDLVMMTVEGVGKRISEDRRPAAEVEACGRAVGDMVCAYLDQVGSRPART